MHPSNKGQAQPAAHRKDLTVIVQRMYIEIWSIFIGDSDADVVLYDELDMQDIENHAKDIPIL